MKSPSIQRSLDNRLTVLAWLLKQGRFSPDKSKLIEHLSQQFEMLEFQLGDVLMVQSGSTPSSSDRKLDSHYFWLICEGRSRLLGFDASKQREVSTNLMAEGAIFGGDFLWSEVLLPYKVVAAGNVRIARISLEKLAPFLSKLPELDKNWQHMIQQQQKLVFLKTLTQLRSLSSHRLKKLLPYLETNKINAGDSLKSEGQPVRFWLRHGQIKDKAMPTASFASAIGDSWGYAESASQNWIAQTNLLVYQLPSRNWQIFSELIPELVVAWSKNPDVRSSQTPLAKTKNTTSVNALVNVKPANLGITHVANSFQDNSSSTDADNEVREIDYPQPIKRRRPWQKYPFIEQRCTTAILILDQTEH